MTGFEAKTAVRLPQVVKAVRTSAPPVPIDIRQRALESTARFIEMAGVVYSRAFAMPTVAFDLRGLTAGQAFFNKNMLRYNAVLLTENEASFHSDIIPHEVAHLIAHQVYGKHISAHGPEWQSVMRRFGAAPRARHNYDVSNSAVGGRHDYTCSCRTHSLGVRQHNKILRGRIYTCAICGTKLRLLGSQLPSASHPRPVTPISRPPMPAPRRLPAPQPKTTAPPAPRAPTSPRPPAPHWQPTVTAPRPATHAQLQYALTLAHRLGIALQPEHVASFEQCSKFIERHKVLAATTAQAPSSRQLDFAKDIARRRGKTLTPDLLADAKKLSAWIDANR